MLILAERISFLKTQFFGPQKLSYKEELIFTIKLFDIHQIIQYGLILTYQIVQISTSWEELI